MSTRIHMVVSDELLALIDEARGEVPRSAWVRGAIERRMALRWAGDMVKRRAVEQALGDDVKRSLRSQDVATRSPAPAEQSRTQAEAELAESEPRSVEEALTGFSRVRSSAAARPFRPAPKKGEK